MFRNIGEKLILSCIEIKEHFDTIVVRYINRHLHTMLLRSRKAFSYFSKNYVRFIRYMCILRSGICQSFRILLYATEVATMRTILKIICQNSFQNDIFIMLEVND